jgi:polyferredoxin
MIPAENRICYKCSKPFQMFSFPLEEKTSTRPSPCCGKKTTKTQHKELIIAQCHDCGYTLKGYSIEELNMVIRHSRIKYLEELNKA